jgi:hypothetical protein
VFDAAGVIHDPMLHHRSNRHNVNVNVNIKAFNLCL